MNKLVVSFNVVLFKGNFYVDAHIAIQKFERILHFKRQNS